jgi:poly(3-hydroxybutyrate) depolymerase
MRYGSAWLAVLLTVVLPLGACSSGSGGSPGAAGTTGAAGQGTTGAAGQGTTGAAGQGTTGAAGQGTTGAAGQGTTGAAGQGTTGAAGQGTTGVAGQGTTGAAGTGTTGAAGTGAAGMGAAGMGAAGMGAAGTGGASKSAGCGKDLTEPTTAWTLHNTMVTVAPAYTANFSKRIYWSRPPTTYDPQTPFALFIWQQGCGQGPTPENIPPIRNPAVTKAAVVVQLLASQANHQCAYAGPDGNAADSPELPYFDNVVKEMSEEFCIDKKRIFQGGYSTGGWFSGLMSCNRATVLRGVGWAAAGLQSNHDPCVGPIAALITRGTGDTGTNINDTMAAIESIRMRNGCGTTTKPWMPTWAAGEMQADTSSCVSYDGCMTGYPLVWCPTPGGHTDTTGDTKLTIFGLWKLFSTLP